MSLLRGRNRFTMGGTEHKREIKMSENTENSEIVQAAAQFYSDMPHATEEEAREHARDLYDDRAHVSDFLRSWQRIKEMRSSFQKAEGNAKMNSAWPEEKYP